MFSLAQTRFDEAMSDFYDAQLRRLDILEHLYDNNLPTHVSLSTSPPAD